MNDKKICSFCGNKKEKYIKYLKGEELWEKGYYIDPDMTHVDGENSDFYKKMSLFLNNREQAMKKGQWEFHMCGPVKGNIEPSGIKVKERDKSIIFLRTDQFGFSAPSGNKKIRRAWDNMRYPYAAYLVKSEGENRYNKVGNWIWLTRTMGGSFLWPLRKCGRNWQSMYNIRRGIGNERAGWCYLQDRVDLTLNEIKHYYMHKTNNNGEVNYTKYEWKDDILFGELCFEMSKGKAELKTWLDHFSSFKEYTEYFMLEDFIENDNIKNIVTGRFLAEGDVEKIKAQKGEIQELSSCELEGMLDNLVSWISKRTARIEKELSI